MNTKSTKSKSAPGLRVQSSNHQEAPAEVSNPSTLESVFGPVIYSYTRKQALADGMQYDLSKIAREAGITFPVFITVAAFELFVVVPDGVEGQDEEGRRWDIVWMLRFAIQRSKPGVRRLPVAFYCRNDNRSPKLHKLIAECGPVDIDDPQPAITLMLPDED